MILISPVFSISGKGFKFLKYHFISLLAFGFLYWLQDILLSNNPQLFIKLGLGKTHPPADSLGYWIWFSALTQTTIGYGGAETSTGFIPFDKITNKVYKVLNFSQMCSVFIITGMII